MSNPQKARLIQKIITALKKRYTSPSRREPLPVIEHLMLAVLSDGTTTEKADTVFQRLKQNYYDWNEVRVSAVQELQEQLEDLPDPEQRAIRLKGCLKYIFETTYGFDLELFKKIPMKEVAKRFEKMPGNSDYLVARVLRDGLGGTAMPLDTTAVRVLTRLEVIDSRMTPQILSASLARQIPRARSFEFCHLLSELGADTCIESEPRCKQCCLLEICPFGEKRLIELQAAAAAAVKRAKPKGKKTKSKTH